MGRYLSNKRFVKRLADDTILFFAEGTFDSWCVFEVKGDNEPNPPRDNEYFQELKYLAGKHTIEKVWNVFSRIYNGMAKKLPNKEMCRGITQLANVFPGDELFADRLFTILYMAMLAEEKRKGTRLGRSIQALGVHQVIIEGMAPEDAAEFSKGLPWREIAALCKERNIHRNQIV